MALPFEKKAPTRTNPKRLVIYGKPKVGKTTAIAHLENTLILDLEYGSAHLEALKVNVIGLMTPSKESKESKKQREENNQMYLSEVYNEIITYRKKNGKFPYDKIVIDTATKLEAWCEDYATSMYMNSVQGKKFNRNKTGKLLSKKDWDSVLTLPNGAGYYWLRNAFMDWISRIDKLATDIILICHIKEKLVNKAGKELNSKDLDLTGKLSNIVAASSDAIAYMRRKRNCTYLNFNSNDDTCGSRCDHLKGREICIMEEIEEIEDTERAETTDKNENNESENKKKLITHWDRIYLNKGKEGKE